MKSIDYRITDGVLDPPGLGIDASASSQPLPLPTIFGCYRPPEPEEEVAVGPPPFERNGFVTFGCLNNPSKTTSNALQLWSTILVAVPDSRLILLGPMEAPHIERAFAETGVNANRIRILGDLDNHRYFETFNKIDIALDPFPYNGQTTSCDGFWMGVPMVSLEGNSYLSRMGCCLLRHLDLNDLVAQTVEQYVHIAVRLAHDLPRLLSLRQTLRQRTRSSPITDGRALALEVEAAYRSVWSDYCRRQNETKLT